MKRLLIVNADDCNLTAGVTRAILDCHDEGIVSSTTFLVNLPVEPATVLALRRRRNLGVGLHLNVTLGSPVSRRFRRGSLTDASGVFRRWNRLRKLPSAADVTSEYAAQIERFRKLFGRLPTHLDTHHQLHDRFFFLKILCHAARRFRLPVRTSRLSRHAAARPLFRGLRSPESLIGDLRAENYWRCSSLKKALASVEAGTHELMCHPGYVDEDLVRLSSFTKGREVEAHVLCRKELKPILRSRGIRLTHFGLML